MDNGLLLISSGCCLLIFSASLNVGVFQMLQDVHGVVSKSPNK